MTTPSFSRLQLAAALIEYDNDADDPEGPYRLARESAIFAHTRRSTSRPSGLGIAGEAGDAAGFRKSKADFLNVKLPSEMDAASERRSLSSGRRTPAGRKSVPPAEDEVDLAEWGLAEKRDPEEDEEGEEDDTFREPERRRVVSEFLPGPSALAGAGAAGGRDGRRVSIAMSELPPSTSAFHQKRARRSSLGDFGAGGAFLDAPAAGRRSFTEPLQTRRLSLAQGETSSLRNPFSPVDGPVPFPSTETPSAPVDKEEEEKNPFALPPPSPSRSSRFDPKAHGRTLSTTSFASKGVLGTDNRRTSRYTSLGQDDARSSRYIDDPRSSRYYSVDDGRSSQYFPAEADEPETRSMLPPSRSRPQSTYLRDEDMDPERARRLSGYNVLRPKVLVMPSPLQNEEFASPASDLSGKAGFIHSKDGPPLPPGAKAERPGPRPLSSMTLSKSFDALSVAGGPGGGGAQSFHLNPRQSLTLSQLTFRNSLMNDVSYVDMGLRRAGQDGEKVTLEVEEQGEEEHRPKGDRAPGALYGRSLIDDLEARKAALRGRQRVFTGDDRPAMMDRPQPKRASTLIDPSSFDKAPLTRQNTHLSTGSGRGLAGVAAGAPLLSFEGEDTLTSPLDPTGTNTNNRMTKSRSTFGVDQIWEKELAKLQAIEAEERKLAEEERRAEEEREARRRKKGKGRVVSGVPSSPGIPKSPPAQTPSVRQTSPPTVLNLPPLGSANGLLSDAHRRESATTLGVHNWFNSDDEEEDESEAEKMDLLTPKRQRQGYEATPTTLPTSLPSQGHQMDDSSEDEDIPLAARMQKLAVTGLPPHPAHDDDSEEEELPLAAVIAKKQLERSVSSKPGSIASGQQGVNDSPRPGSFTTPTRSGALPTFDFGGTGGLADSLGLGEDTNTTPTKTAAGGEPTKPAPANESDDDDVPLGLRHPGAAVHPPAGGDDDEAPLGMRFPQAAMQQHAQAQALQQQQYMLMMQQQMMWQEAQMRNSIAFPTAPSVMGMPGALAPQMTGFGIPYAPPMMANVPPSISDPGKFNRVDQWRRGVGVDDQ